MTAEKTLLGNSIAREQWLLREIQIVAQLRFDGLSDEDVVDKVKDENLFQYPTERTLGNIAHACIKRLDLVDSDEIVRIIANGEPEAAVQANLYAIMCTYPLVRNFMLEVVARKYMELDYSFGAIDMNSYFTRLEAEYDNFANASDSTIGKLKQVLKKFLVEARFLDSPKSEELSRVFLDIDVKSAIVAKGDTGALAAFNCWGFA